MHLGLRSIWEPEAQLCSQQCQHLTSTSPHLVPSSGAYALPMPGLQDDNRIRNGTDLIRLRILEESCNLIAELSVRLGVWPVEGVRGGAGAGGALSSDIKEAAQSWSCLGPSEGWEIPGEQLQRQCLPCAVVAASGKSRRETLGRL